MNNKRLEQIKYVVDNSEYVSINKNNLEKYADNLKELDHQHWLSKYKCNFTEEQIIIFCFLVESMNFCFWKKPSIIKQFDGQQHKKSTALFYSLLDEALNNPKFLELNYLENLKKEDLMKILNADDLQPFLEERYCNLIETINTIKSVDNFFDKLFNIRNIEDLYSFITSNFKSFNDVSIYKDKEVRFYKRATLLIDDLFNVSPKINANIKTIDELLACADYGIPRTLRHYGVLEYSQELEKKIMNKEIILHDSNYEIEIRANMIYALELIKDYLARKGIIINTITLDNIIWLYGTNIDEPYHLTETIYY